MAHVLVFQLIFPLEISPMSKSAKYLEVTEIVGTQNKNELSDRDDNNRLENVKVLCISANESLWRYLNPNAFSRRIVGSRLRKHFLCVFIIS